MRLAAGREAGRPAGGSVRRERRIKAVILEKREQAANRRQKGSRVGRPVTHDTGRYRDTVERAIDGMKDWRGIAAGRR